MANFIAVRSECGVEVRAPRELPRVHYVTCATLFRGLRTTIVQRPSTCAMRFVNVASSAAGALDSFLRSQAECGRARHSPSLRTAEAARLRLRGMLYADLASLFDLGSTEMTDLRDQFGLTGRDYSVPEAQALIAEWEGGADAGPKLSPEDQAQRDQYLQESQVFFQAGELLRAQEALIAAGELAPLRGEDQARMEEVQTRLAPLQQQIALVEQGEWDAVLKDLWNLQLEDPGNRDVVRLLTDCYYNLGVRDLQRNQVGRAQSRFGEVLELDPDDVEAQRHYRFAQVYEQRQPDLLYRTYVKYIPFR